MSLTTCQKDDGTTFAETEVTSEGHKRIKVNYAIDVSNNIIDFIKEKTQSTFSVSIGEKQVKFNHSNIFSRNESFGTVDTSSEIVVFNENNTKHTLLVENENLDDSIINLIVVETELEIFEYFLKYLFTGTKYYMEDGSIDMTRFTGSIETYNSEGDLVGTTTVQDGSITSVTGDTSTCPEEQTEDNTDADTDPNDTNNNDNNTGGGVPTDPDNPGDGDPVDNGDGGGGWFDGGPDWSFCTLTNVYFQPCQIQIDNPDDFPNPQPHPAESCGAGTGAYDVYVWDCPSSLGGRTSTTSQNITPCDGFTGVLLRPVNHEKHCEELKALAEDLKTKQAFDYLQQKADDVSITREYGFSFSLDGDPQEASLIAGSNGLKLDVPTGGSIYGHGHTHPYISSDDEKAYPMFSLEDIIKLAEVIDDHEGQVTQELVNKAFSTLTVKQENGTETYAIKVDNFFQFIDFITKFSDLEHKKKDKIIYKLKNKYKTLYRSTETNQTNKYLKELFSFIDRVGLMGISIYKSTDENLNDWEKMTFDAQTQELTDPIPCNN